MVLFEISQKNLKKCGQCLKKVQFDAKKGKKMIKCNFYTCK